MEINSKTCLETVPVSHQDIQACDLAFVSFSATLCMVWPDLMLLVWPSKRPANTSIMKSSIDLANEAVLRSVFKDIEAIAAAKLAREFNSSLSTGDLVNEAVIKLTKLDRIEIRGKEHILALASRMMRQILIDQSRRRNALKHYHTRVTLATNLPDAKSPVDLLDFGFVLEELREIDPQRADIVEMRYFGGMTIEEIGVVLSLSSPTIKRRWVAARIWLQERLAK